MSNHTPGPWIVQRIGKGRYRLVEAAQEQDISDAGSKYDALYMTATLRDVANARLIAAAPGLFDACLSIISAYEGERGISDSDIGTDGDDTDNGRYVTTVDGVLIADAYPDTHLDLGLPESMDVARANARLIAAAPELLEALLNLVCCPAFTGELLERDKESHKAWTLARAAIARAQGE